MPVASDECCSGTGWPNNITSLATQSLFKEVIPNKQMGLSFNLLKTNRQTIALFLEAQKSDGIFVSKIAPEICQALLMGTFIAPDHQWKILKDKYDSAKLNHDKEKLKNIQIQMLAYCTESRIYDSYVNHLEENGEMGYQIALLYAKQAGFSLYLWEKDPDHKDMARIVDYYDAEENASKILHFDTAGFIITGVLLPNGEKIEDIYGPQPNWSFTVYPADGSPYPSNQIPPSNPVEILPSYYYEYDAWNNLTTLTDTLGNVTEREYGHDNQLCVLTQPQVYIMKPDNSIVFENPIIYTGYNQRRHKIGVMDANGNTQAIVVDSAGQETARVLGDGLVVREQNFGLLSERLYHIDARGYKWSYQYNHLTAITKIEYPSKLTKYYTYNELNLRTSDTDQSNLTIKYDYDPLENISMRYSPFATSMTFDRNRQMISTTNPDGSSMAWIRDYFGVELHHVDLGGVFYTDWHDFKGQVTRHFSNSVRMNYGGAAIGFLLPTQTEVYQIATWDLPTTDYNFQYDAGRLWLMLDGGLYSTEYEYNSENQETTVYRGGRIIHSLIDALGEIVYTHNSAATDNSAATVMTLCDGNRNPRHVVMDCVQTKDIWYTYDKANRVVYDSNTGLILTYQAGFRVQETNSNGPYRTLAYDIDGRSTDISYYQIALPNVIETHRSLKENGELAFYTEAENNAVYFQHGIYRDAYNRQYFDGQTLDGKSTTASYGNFNNMGLPSTQYISYNNGAIIDDMTITYGVSYEDHKLTSVSGARYDKYGWGNASTAVRQYGPNGMPSVELGLQDSADPSSSAVTSKFFEITYDGKILRRQTATGSPLNGAPAFLSGTVTTSSYYHNSRGELIASYGTDPSNPEAYQITLNYMQHVTNQFGSQFKSAVGGRFWNSKWGKEIKQKFQKAQSQKIKDFEAQAHVPHLEMPDYVQSYPAQGATKCIAGPGDTCTSIAHRETGDDTFGSAIASANGIATADETLPIGENIDIPQFLPNTNNIDDKTPYDTFMRIMIGNLYPHLDLKQPPPPPKKHSGGWLGGIVGDVVHAIVDVAAGVIGFVVTGFNPAGAALFASLADAAFQEVTTGSINVMAALVAGIESGISMGVMAPAGSIVGTGFAALGKSLASQTLQQAVMKAGEIAVANQLVEMAAGMRAKFDFDALFAEMGTAMIMHGEGPAEDTALGLSKTGFTASVFNSETGVLVDSGLEAAEGQKVDIGAAAAQALGSVVGSEMGADFKTDWDKTHPQVSEAYNQAKQDSVNAQNQQRNSQNPGRNRNGFFAASKSDDQNSPSNQQQHGNDNSSWLTEDPKKRLEDAGVDISGNDATENSNQPSISPIGSKEMVEMVHKGLGIAATGGGIGEFSKVMGNQWRAPNGTWFDRASSDVLATENELAAISDSKIFHAAGRFMVWTDTAISFGEGIDNIANHNYFGASKNGLDIAVGLIGLTNPIGLAYATTYFVVDQFIGWNNVNTAIVETDQVDEYNQEITGAGIWERAKFQ